ncbi:MAG: hypothetical protein IJW48_00605 [Clostridia bacterium]|nr:hypothetical protein [Clostridia bacterium]
MGGSGLFVILAVIVATILIAIGACALLGVAIFVIVKNNKAKSAVDDTAAPDTDGSDDCECTEEGDTVSEGEDSTANEAEDNTDSAKNE